MRLLLWITIFTICSVHLTQGGIYRRYVRRNRPRPPRHALMPFVPMPYDDHLFARREFSPYVTQPQWPGFSFRRPTRSLWAFPPLFQRQPRRLKHPSERADSVESSVPKFHHKPTHHRGFSRNPRHFMGTTPFRVPWRPYNYGNPLERDPTFDYAPPTLDRVKFNTEGPNRRTTARSHSPVTTPFPQNRPAGSPPPPPAFKQRPSSIWKMLAQKQRPKRPFPPQFQRPHQPQYNNRAPPYPNQYVDEAEIFPHMPNMIYFRPTDVMPPHPHHGYRRPPRPGPPKHPGFHPPRPPGKPTTNAHKGSGESSEVTSKSESKDKASKGGNKEYLFTVVGIKGAPAPPAPLPPTTAATTKKPNVKTTPLTITTTHNSLLKPYEPTESLDHNLKNHKSSEEVVEAEEVEEAAASSSENVEKVVNSSGDDSSQVDLNPIEPIFPNSFNILDSIKDDGEGVELEVEDEGNQVVASSAAKPRPVFNSAVKNPLESYKTSTSVSISMSKTDDASTTAKAPQIKSTTTPKPTTIRTSTTSSSTTTEVVTQRSTKFPKLPTMPAYKKKTPVYARKNKNAGSSLGKYSSSSSSSSLSKEISGSGSGEVIVITANRSKVKEYKPQTLENSQLLSFDKVESSTSAVSSEITSSTPSPSATSKSPLQEFDPLNLFNSWFSKPTDK